VSFGLDAIGKYNLLQMRRSDKRRACIVVARLVLAGLAVLRAAPAAGETAILECTADASFPGASSSARAREIRMPGMALFSFRTWNVTRWNVEKATVFLHISSGAAPSMAEVAAIPEKWAEIELPRLEPAKLKFVSQKIQREPENWIALDIPGAMVEAAAANRAHGFVIRFKEPKELVLHSRESVSFSPYLIVSGAVR
jgi:hypothetical protein